MLFDRAAIAGSSHPVKPASGNTTQQTIGVNTPYCDTYSAYHYDGKTGEITSNTTGTVGNTTDPIASDGSFDDQGSHILGTPNSSFYSDGSDLTRLFTRLFVPGAKSTCDPDAAPQQSISLKSVQYLLVHVVHWQVKDSVYTYTTADSQWYIFNISDKKEAHRQFPFTFHRYVSSDLRMFGSSNAFFLAIHMAPAGQYADFKKTVKIMYKLKVQKIEPANVQDFKALVGVVTGVVPAIAKTLKEASETAPYDGIYGFSRVTGLANLPVQITAAMDAARSSNASVQQADPVGGTTQTTTTESKQPKINSSKQPKNDAATKDRDTSSNPPSTGCPDQNQASSPGKNQTSSFGDCSETATVQDEGLYSWDVSVGVPFKSYKDLQVSNGSVTTATVSRQTAYGFLVWAPFKEDVVSPPSLGIPHILVGVPFTGKVLDSPFFGLGETINFAKLPGIGNSISKLASNLSVRFYAGLSENKLFSPASTPDGTPPSRWVGKLQYGIEFSIRDVASKLSGSSKTQTSGGN
jgi:hypothetical protein